MANIIFQIRNLLIYAIDIYRFLLIVYFLMSWLPGAYQSKLGQILYQICEPYISFFRQFVPPVGNLSFAGIFALLALGLIESGLDVVIDLLIRLVS